MTDEKKYNIQATQQLSKALFLENILWPICFDRKPYFTALFSSSSALKYHWTVGQ